MDGNEQLDAALDEARRIRGIARNAKREKQRLASFDRAAKMHSARIENQSVAIGDRPALAPQKYHVGCSGWFYWHWRDIFYPQEIPRTDWLHHYAKNFDTVELNAPFYSWPTISTVKTWI